MTSLEGPPPHRAVSSFPITLEAGSSMLARYLQNSEAHPHLHPDALITPTGVTFSSHGGPTGGVVMHNLRRVAAGLRGEYLEPEPTPEPEELPETVAGDVTLGRKEKNIGREAREEGWQDIAEYEAEVGAIEVGDVGERTRVVQDGGEAPEIEVVGEKRKKSVVEAADGKLDKEARKKAKKQRDAERKKENEKKRVADAA